MYFAGVALCIGQWRFIIVPAKDAALEIVGSCLLTLEHRIKPVDQSR